MARGPDISRRSLFRGGFFGRRERPSQPQVYALPQRPPGAVAEGQFLASCTRCAECIEACPPGALRPMPAHAGERLHGTPAIDAIEQACVMCTDLPCISACEPGVLRPELPVKMADVEIVQAGCLPWQGQTCSMCSDHCPVEGAITVDDQGRPTIEPALCTGCGTCVQICPAPGHAIDLTPAAVRPFWSGMDA